MADDKVWVGKENARIARRRAALNVAPPEVAPDAGASEGSPQPGAWALALSGGGIRSATFALGVLQALAKAKLDPGHGKPTAWLRCFDYLSTVSGGGYIGAFFGSLFMPRRLEPPPGEERWFKRALAQMLPERMRGRFGLAQAPAAPAAPQDEKSEAEHCRDAAEMAYTVLKDDPPGRVRSREDYDWRRRPLAWLRDNGRYLTPNGAGDYLYAAALAVRNWLSLHYVIGMLLLLSFALVLVLKSLLLPAGAHAWWIHVQLARLGGLVPAGWNPLWALPAAVSVLWVVPSGIAFWLSSDRAGIPSFAKRLLTKAFLVNAGLALILVALYLGLPVATLYMQLTPSGVGLFVEGVLWLALLIGLSVVLHFLAVLACDSVEGQRVWQTRCLALGMKLVAALRWSRSSIS